LLFFFQAEDGIRDRNVTGVQTCALPILSIAVKLYMSHYNRAIGRKIGSAAMAATAADSLSDSLATTAVLLSTLAGHFWNVNIDEIGRASCRERVELAGGAGV